MLWPVITVQEGCPSWNSAVSHASGKRACRQQLPLLPNAVMYCDRAGTTAYFSRHCSHPKKQRKDQYLRREGKEKPHPPLCMGEVMPLTQVWASQSTAPKCSSTRPPLASCFSHALGSLKLVRYHMRDMPEVNSGCTPAHALSACYTSIVLGRQKLTAKGQWSRDLQPQRGALQFEIDQETWWCHRFWKWPACNNTNEAGKPSRHLSTGCEHMLWAVQRYIRLPNIQIGHGIGWELS